MFTWIFGVIISIAYVLLGLGLLLIPPGILHLTEFQIRLLSAVLVVYGIFRFFRYFRARKQERETDSEIIDSDL